MTDRSDGPADRERVVHERRDAAFEGQRIVRDAELALDRGRVEVHALADEPVLVEQEQRDHPAGELPSGRRQPAKRSEVRALQVELDDHRVIGVVQRDQLVALVGERRARLLEVARHLALPVVYVAGGDDLVARVVERAHRGVEVEPVLGLHVLAHRRLALAAQRRAGLGMRRVERRGVL